MSYRFAVFALLASIVASSLAGDVAPDVRSGGEDRPLDSSLVERTERRLVQLDISLFPRKKRSEAAIPELNADDLELVIHGTRIDIRYADRLCRAVETDPPVETTVATDVASSAPDPPQRLPEEIPTGRGVYLFYFEHGHLTMQGQQHALVMAEEMIPQLVGQGTRGMIVSSAQKLLQSDLTEDPDELLEFLGRIRRDPAQWGEMAYAEGEAERYDAVFDQQRFEYSVDLAQRRALAFARDEYARTNRQLRRLASVLGSFAELDPPKAVLYFADIVRKNAGGHYGALFSTDADSATAGAVGFIAHNAAMAAFAFDKVTEQAASHGTRLYTIRARGLVLGSSTTIRSPAMRPNQLTVADRGMRDADETMIAFALETGGASFRGGVENSTINKVLNRIRADLSCFYLLSFYPDGLPVDSLLPVRVRFNVDSPRYDELNAAWDLRSRGQLMVQSEARRREAILLAAHTTPDSVDSKIGQTVLIPLGFVGDRYRVLAQFAVDNPALPDQLSSSTTWDLGMSLVSRDKVQQHVAKRLEVGTAGVPVVLEAAWDLPPGPGELVSVGYEHRYGQLAADDVETDWPDPEGPAASITPIAVVHPASGVFLRVDPAGEEDPRDEGPLAIGDGPANLNQPLYFIGLVCRGKRSRDLWIDRKLVGNMAVDFEVQAWSGDDEERCVQIRDLIQPGQAGWGDFRYEVRVYADETLESEPLAERVREFTGLEGGAGWRRSS